MIAPFTGNPDLDYFLSNLENLLFSTASGTGGEVPDYTPVGTASAYLFQYLHVKYADDNIGTGLSNSPTNKTYLGLFNSPSAIESTNPADYTWTLVSGGGFGLTKSFYYKVIPGRVIDYSIAVSGPGDFTVDSGSAIDLISLVASPYARLCFSKSDQASMANNPVSVTTIGPLSFPELNTWDRNEVWSETPPTLLTNEILYRSEGIHNPTTNNTTWNAPYVSNLEVGSLSSISVNLGTIQVDTANIANAAITNAKIGSLAVDSANIANLAVDTIKINNFAVSNFFSGIFSTTVGSQFDISIGAQSAGTSIIVFLSPQGTNSISDSQWLWCSAGLNGTGSVAGGTGSPLSFFWAKHMSPLGSVSIKGATSPQTGVITIPVITTSGSNFVRLRNDAGNLSLNNSSYVIMVVKK